MTDLEEAKRERSADVNGGPEPAPASAAVGALLLGGPVPESQGRQSLRQFENSVLSVTTCAKNEAVHPSLGLHLSFTRDLQKLFSLRHCGPSSRTSFRSLSSVQSPLPVPLCLVFGSDDVVTFAGLPCVGGLSSFFLLVESRPNPTHAVLRGFQQWLGSVSISFFCVTW